MDPEKYLLSILSKRAYTRKELMDRLIRRDLAKEEAEKLLDRYQDLGYIDDLAYAKLYIISHTSWGSIKIAHQLRIRGVEAEKIEEAFQDTGYNEFDEALSLAINWFEHGVTEKKIYSRLISRGFSYEIAGKAVSVACE